MIRDIKEIRDMLGKRKGSPGKPLTKLDYKVGQNEVLTSNEIDGVGANITGYIRFDKAGEYTFVANSNDGIRLEVGGQLVLEDPDVHADRFSAAGVVIVKDPGWYDLHIIYFERRNESTMQVFWKEPGASNYVIVPPTAIGYRK